MTRGWLLWLLLLSLPASAHVGSPDVFFDGMAGPYPVLVVIRPPAVIPGTAQVEIRTTTPLHSAKFLPMPLTGPGSKFPPTADAATPSPADPNLYTGQLWMMDFGSWQVRITLEGNQGTGTISVPVPALATQSKPMDRTLGFALFGVMTFLVIGLASIVEAAVRESTLQAGAASPSAFRPRSLILLLGTSLAVVGCLYLGGKWWGAEAGNYSRKLYKPLAMQASVTPDHQLTLRLSDPGWLQLRKLDDLEPDHGHLMHLYAIREPAMDAVFHLHPDQVHPGSFEMPLPAMPSGTYKLFGDIVHASGLGETPVGELQISSSQGGPLTGDNAGGLLNVPEPDGSRMVWVRGRPPVRANEVQRFVFRLEDAAGKPLTDLEPYMGMAGHAAFVRKDFSTFAHIHPTGSAPMPALMLAGGMPGMHDMPAGAEVSFPYAFPAPGAYRVFVQLKRAGKVRTAGFDVDVQ